MPVPRSLPLKARRTFEKVIESNRGRTNPRTGKAYTGEQRGRIAWAAVKKNYKKVGEKWEPK
jgi:hypothetical protein